MDVLIVEDDDSLRMVWVGALEDAGHRVTAVASRNDAMRVLLTGRFDLIVLDVLVKDSNALALTDYISYAQPDASVMVVTGSGFFPNGEHGNLIPHVDWFLRKPVPVSDFMAIVEHANHLALRRATLPEQSDPAFVSGL